MKMTRWLTIMMCLPLMAVRGHDFLFARGGSALCIPFDGGNRHIAFQARLNDRDGMWLVLDTGAGGSVLDDKRAESLGLETHGTQHALGSGGSAEGSTVHGVNVTLPGFRLVDQTMGTLQLASIAAQAGRLVTFGVKPSRADTGYGYIQCGEPVEGIEGVFSVDRFVEKPDHDTAQRFVDSGTFFWNSGIFLLSARAYIGELSRINPAMLSACERAVQDGKEDLTFFRLCADSFGKAPELSIDHAVMEHTTRAAVVPVDMAWNDVGSWPALRGVGQSDGDGNVLLGDVLAERVHNSYIRSEGPLVATVGLDNVIVVATDDAVLVADADSAAEVSGIVARLRGQNRPESQQHVTCHRPWGHYRTVDIGERFQVKRITVKPGGKLSLQKHYHRA